MSKMIRLHLIIISFLFIIFNQGIAKLDYQDKVEQTLKESGIDFVVTEDGLRVSLIVDDETTMLYLNIFQGFDTDTNSIILTIRTTVKKLPENIANNKAFFLFLNTQNASPYLGKFTYYDEGNLIIYEYSFYTKDTGSYQFFNALYDAHYARLMAKKQIDTFLSN